MPDDIDGLQLKNTPFRLFDNLIVHAETEFGENYSHKMAILSRTGRNICESQIHRILAFAKITVVGLNAEQFSASSL